MSKATRRKPSRRAQVRFLEAGLRALADQGHAGLKLATVCDEVGATSGSFYYAFPSWGDFTSELIRYWREEMSTRLIDESSGITSAPERLRHLVDIGVRLPHRSEAAIRVWAAHDPHVASVVAEVDQERHAAIATAYATVVPDVESARRYATAAMYLLIGHEGSAVGTAEDLRWAFRTLVDQALAGSDSEDLPRET